MPDHDTVNYGSIESGYRVLCTRCFNAEVARLTGLEDFETPPLQSISLRDCQGVSHEFHFQTRLFGAGLMLEAFELQRGEPAGYRFRIVGDVEDDVLGLLGRLVERMRRALAVHHLKAHQFGTQILDQSVRGRITWDDESDGRLPMLVIDGREIPWDAFGHMLMSFEGWQFRLEIVDPGDEV